MTPTRTTADVIAGLATEAGRGGGHHRLWLERRLTLAAVLALGIGWGLAVTVFGIAPAVPGPAFWHKVLSALALAAGGLVAVRSLARPGGSGWPAAVVLLPGAAVLAFGGISDHSGYPVMGASAQSVPICLGAIVALSLPGLAMILAVLRGAAATRPGVAGAAAGLLSGALGAAAYAVACKNDGGLFVAIWYGAAIAVVAGLGAVAGRRTLSW